MGDSIWIPWIYRCGYDELVTPHEKALKSMTGSENIIYITNHLQEW